jgi:hypothetical protein
MSRGAALSRLLFFGMSNVFIATSSCACFDS